MFIATANYKDQIPEALKDRLEIINLSGYTASIFSSNKGYFISSKKK